MFRGGKLVPSPPWESPWGDVLMPAVMCVDVRVPWCIGKGAGGRRPQRYSVERLNEEAATKISRGRREGVPTPKNWVNRGAKRQRELLHPPSERSTRQDSVVDYTTKVVQRVRRGTPGLAARHPKRDSLRQLVHTWLFGGLKSPRPSPLQRRTALCEICDAHGGLFVSRLTAF